MHEEVITYRESGNMLPSVVIYLVVFYHSLEWIKENHRENKRGNSQLSLVWKRTTYPYQSELKRVLS